MQPGKIIPWASKRENVGVMSIDKNRMCLFVNPYRKSTKNDRERGHKFAKLTPIPPPI